MVEEIMVQEVGEKAREDGERRIGIWRWGKEREEEGRRCGNGGRRKRAERGGRLM